MHDDDTQEFPIIRPAPPLTPRLTEEINRFAKVLDTCPDDLLFDSITTPQQSKLPRRWHD